MAPSTFALPSLHAPPRAGRSYRLRRRAAALALLAGVLWAASASAQRPEKAFRQGVQAADRGEWSDVERFMRQAIQLDSQESRRKISITGMRYEQYLPYYYLGLALCALGREEAAREAWATSRRQGAWERWRDASVFDQQWQDLVRKIGPPPSRVATAPPPPPLSPPPALASPDERLRLAVAGLEKAARDFGPPSTPRLKLLLSAAAGLGEARALGRGNRVASATEKKRLAEKLGTLTRRIEKAGSRKLRRSRQRVIDDLRTLLGEAQSRGATGGDLETAVVDLGLELGRNEPDVKKLMRLESELLRAFHPELGQDPAISN